MTDLLTFDSVSKTFGGKAAVNDISFSVGRGEIVGFLGPNGAGKTTSIRMGLGIVRPSSGRVTLFDDRPGPAAFGRIGFLPEERGLYKKQTAREAVAHIARLNGVHKADAFKTADEMLERYGLGDVAAQKVKSLSKGMAQKVQLLAAIAHDPEFSILDEPFSGLDPVNQQVLEGIVRDLSRPDGNNAGRTVLFSTHVMEHAERLCDRIILMANGRVAFDGKTSEALERAPYRLIVASPDPRLTDTLTPFAQTLSREGDTVHADLHRDATSQAILERLVGQGVTITRFEPRTPTLHEAFVAMVGAEVLGDMAANVTEDTPLEEDAA